MHEKRYSSTILKLILGLMGVSVDPIHRKYQKYRIFSYFVCLPPIFLSEVFAFTSLDTFVYKMDAAMYFVCTFFFAALIVIVYRQRCALSLTYENIARNKEFVGEEFFAICDPRLRASIKSFGIFISVGLAIFGTIPISIAGFSDAELGSLPTLQFPGVYPWLGNTPLTYALTICIQAVISIFAQTSYLGIMLFTVYSHVLISSLASLLKCKVNKIEILNQSHWSNESGWKCSSVNFKAPKKFTTAVQKNLDQRIRQNLRDIVRYHQFMTK